MLTMARGLTVMPALTVIWITRWGLCIDKSDAFAQTVLAQMAAIGYNGGSSGHAGVAEQIRADMQVMAYQTMSNHEMGALFVQTFRQTSSEFQKVVSPEPRRILRFCAYAAASDGGGDAFVRRPVQRS